jgi:phenylacetic acid degradation protein
MGAILDEEVTVGDGCIIGAACFVPRGTSIPPRKVVVGVPGRVVGDVTSEKEDRAWWGTRVYQELPARCHSGLRRID